MGSVFSWWNSLSKNLSHLKLIVVYFMLILVSGAKMQLPLQLGVTDRQTYSTTTVTLCACPALRVNEGKIKVQSDAHYSLLLPEMRF